jgi:hypothetical protein
MPAKVTLKKHKVFHMLPLNPTPRDIFHARLFGEPLVPIGPDPTPDENAALADALSGYSRRSGPDDFVSLTSFLETSPKSPWNAALLATLGHEYYCAGYYSKALDAWRRAWKLAKLAADLKGKALADGTLGELAYMHARLGQMTELDEFLNFLIGRRPLRVSLQNAVAGCMLRST